MTPFADYVDFADCVAKNSGKTNPKAYCASIMRKVEGENVNLQEKRRHWDFKRIYSEFLSCYPNHAEADRNYYQWLRIMKLDETEEYAQARESYLWKRENLQFVREDATHKYYEVEVGFPRKSMNGNVYSKRDLVAASLTLKGKSPSLNHKNEFWFSPKNPYNRWGNIKIVDGRFHEGISKALMGVPKDMVCPVCKGDEKMVHLIDQGRIYNVSLEGDCAGGRCPTTGECEGFYYTDPPFTLLTTKVLPGFPMTRIKPLESYIPQSSILRGKTTRIKPKLKTGEKKMVKVKVKIKEEADPAKMGHKKPGTTGRDTSAGTNVYTPAMSGGPDGPSGESGGQFRGNLQSVSQQTKVAVGTDPAAAKPEGVWQTSINEPESNPAHEQADQKETIPKGTLAPTRPAMKLPKSATPKLLGKDQPMPRVDSHIGPDKTGKVNPDLTVSKLPSGDSKRAKPQMGPDTHPGAPTPPGTWRDGTEKRPDKTSVYSGEPALHGEAAATVRAIKAEYEAKGLSDNLKMVEATWINKYSTLMDAHNRLLGRSGQQEDIIKQQQAQLEKHGVRLEDLRVEMRELKNQHSDATTLNTKYSNLIEELRTRNTELDRKYNESLKANLTLSNKATEANEDYLEMFHKAEQLQEALKKAKILSKKTLKIKV